MEDFGAWFTTFPITTTPVIISSDFNIHRDAPSKRVAFSVPRSLNFQQSFPQLTSAIHSHRPYLDLINANEVTTSKLQLQAFRPLNTSTFSFQTCFPQHNNSFTLAESNPLPLLPFPYPLSFPLPLSTISNIPFLPIL